ncbi:hypothetical protein ACH5RR_022258 [Cinchona calisaya]|uniref:Uncharacterized protein n=1 Tax=Cinchona calisaya TaxID=153742 RepID=A0ABD2Z7A6_9GENT
MSENPLQSVLRTFLNASNCLQTHLSQFIKLPHLKNPPTTTNDHQFPFFSLSLSSSSPSPATSEPKKSNFNPASTLLLLNSPSKSSCNCNYLASVKFVLE